MTPSELKTLLRIKPEFIPNNSPNNYLVAIEVESISNKTKSHIVVKVNNKVYFDNFLVDGNNKLLFIVDNQTKRQLLKIILDNKEVSDTVLDNKGNIIADKNVTITHIKFDDVNIRNYIYKSKFKRYDKKEPLRFNSMLAFNGEWALVYTNPPIPHLIRYVHNSEPHKVALAKQRFDELVEVYHKRISIQK